MRGRNTAEFFGAPATGNQVEVPGMHMVRIADGKVAEHWGFNDDLAMWRQLGATPPQ